MRGPAGTLMRARRPSRHGAVLGPRALAVSVVCLGLGCGPKPVAVPDDDGWIGGDEAASPSYVPMLGGSDGGLDDAIAAAARERLPPGPAEDASRPPRRRVVSVELRDAPLDEVLGFLADAGGFGIVIEPGPGRLVTVSLHRVEPYDALVTVAESNGLRVRYADGVVVVAP